MWNRQVYFVACILAVVGVGVFFYKWLITGLPLHPGKMTTTWDIERQISFDADGGPVKVVIQVPGNAPTVNVLRERILALRYGISRSAKGGNRQVLLSLREGNGHQLIFIRTILHRFHAHGAPEPQSQRVVRPQLEGPKLATANEMLAIAEAKSADDATFVTVLLKLMADVAISDWIIETTRVSSDTARQGDAAVKLLALKGIAARRINGIDLKGSRRHVEVLHWLEVNIDGFWKNYSLETGEAGVPDSYFPWWRGNSRAVSVTGGTNPKSFISLVQIKEPVLDRVLSARKLNQDKLIVFSLFSLPVATQDVYRILMVVPLGIFFLVILRNVIGIRSLGTFMPVLIALAFRETQLVWGVILFVVMVGGGLLFRLYVDQLRLLLVPRLASVLIMVLLLMAAISVLFHALGLERGLSVALFPMVIMTMAIERISIIWDERGSSEAIKQSLGSLAIASLCYLIMTRPLVEHIFFTFPELILLVLAATMVLGRYTGYRLLELKRFKALAGETN